MRYGKSRYFKLFKVNPSNDDIITLIRKCIEIDSHLAFKIVADGKLNRVVLECFIVLRGRRAAGWQMLDTFKGFYVGFVAPNDLKFEKIADQVHSHACTSGNSDDGVVVSVGEYRVLAVKEHPYRQIRMRLFN